MSLYIGKDDVGNSMMHITKGVNTVNEMKNGILSNTVFHSDLPYLTYTSYDAISYTDYYKAGYYDVTSVQFPSEAISDIISGNKLYLVVVNGEVLNTSDFYTAEIPVGSNIPVGVSIGTWYASDSYIASSEQIYYSDYSYAPSYGYNYKKIQGAGKRNVKLVVINVNIDGGWILPSFTGNDIFISSSGIIIKGVDILNYRYLSPLILNSTDSVLSNGITTFQLINEVGGSSLTLSTYEDITIKIDNKVIFSTSTSASRVFFNSSSKYASSLDILYVDTGIYNRQRAYCLASLETFEEGEHFFMGISLGSDYYYSDSIFGSSLLTFTTGQLFSICVTQTGPSTYTHYSLVGYDNKLYVTNEIAELGNPPFTSGPLNWVINITRLKAGGI